MAGGMQKQRINVQLLDGQMIAVHGQFAERATHPIWIFFFFSCQKPKIAINNSPQIHRFFRLRRKDDSTDGANPQSVESILRRR